MNVERTRAILLVIATILLFVRYRIDDIALREELSPSVIAVAGQQGMVEIENGEGHSLE